VAVHTVADPDPDAAIPEGLAATVDLADVERGDGFVEGHLTSVRPFSVSRRRHAPATLVAAVLEDLERLASAPSPD
jgi:hypothetical protein